MTILLPLVEEDIDTHVMCVDTPFYHWLVHHDQPIFIEAMRIYLGMGAYGPHPDLTGEYVNTYRNIHTAYIWAVHNAQVRSKT